VILVSEVHVESDLCDGIVVNRAASQSVVSSKVDSGVYYCSPKYNCAREGTAKLGGRIPYTEYGAILAVSC